MPNVLAALFRNFGPPLGLKRFTVRQKFASHSLAWLDYDIADRAEYIMPPEHTPVEVRWGVSPVGVRSFYGYVNHYETLVEDGVPFTRLWVLGTSKVMNANNPRTWHWSSRSAIARDIARTHNLRSLVHPHHHVVETWATGTRTDFQALQDLAAEIGYQVWVDGSTLYFLDPEKVLSGPQTLSIPSFGTESLHRVKISGGSSAKSRAKRQVVYGLDRVSNELFVATGGDQDYEQEMVNTPVLSFSAAELATEAAKRVQNDYYTAQVVADGNSAVFPGALIELPNGKHNTDQGGRWVTTEASHVVSSDLFTTSFTATRGKGFYLPRRTTTVRGTTEFLRAQVRNGKVWEAEFQEHVYV